MKTAIAIIVVGLALLLVAGTADAAKKYLNGKKIAEVGLIDTVDIYEVKVSTSTTCYVTKRDDFREHAISCVK